MKGSEVGDGVGVGKGEAEPVGTTCEKFPGSGASPSENRNVSRAGFPDLGNCKFVDR